MKANDNFLDVAFWTQRLHESYAQLKATIISYAPNVLAAFVVLLAGWLVAKVARYLGVKIGLLFYKLVSTFEKKFHIKPTRDKNKFSKALGGVFYWLILVYFIFFALRVLNLPGVTVWLSQLVALAPLFVSSIAIVFLGFVLGTIAKQAVYTSFESQDGRDPYFLAQSVRFGIIIVFVIWGVGQLGIDVSILTNFISVILATLFGAAALGFGIGSSSHVSNLIAAYNIKRNFQIGEKVKFQDIQGTVTDITNTALILETEEGAVVIPAKLTNEFISFKSL